MQSVHGWWLVNAWPDIFGSHCIYSIALDYFHLPSIQYEVHPLSSLALTECPFAMNLNLTVLDMFFSQIQNFPPPDDKRQQDKEEYPEKRCLETSKHPWSNDNHWHENVDQNLLVFPCYLCLFVMFHFQKLTSSFRKLSLRHVFLMSRICYQNWEWGIICIDDIITLSIPSYIFWNKNNKAIRDRWLLYLHIFHQTTLILDDFKKLNCSVARNRKCIPRSP